MSSIKEAIDLTKQLTAAIDRIDLDNEDVSNLEDLYGVLHPIASDLFRYADYDLANEINYREDLASEEAMKASSPWKIGDEVEYRVRRTDWWGRNFGMTSIRSGVIKDVERKEQEDVWYFRVTEQPGKTDYQNVLCRVDLKHEDSKILSRADATTVKPTHGKTT